MIVDAVRYSRQWSGDTEKDYGGFLQVDNRCKVKEEDGGRYSCRPSNTELAVTTVYVIRGKDTAHIGGESFERG